MRGQAPLLPAQAMDKRVRALSPWSHSLFPSSLSLLSDPMLWCMYSMFSLRGRKREREERVCVILSVCSYTGLGSTLLPSFAAAWSSLPVCLDGRKERCGANAAAASGTVFYKLTHTHTDRQASRPWKFTGGGISWTRYVCVCV